MALKLGVVGATGEVGRTMLKVLKEMNVGFDELHLFASRRSAGKKLSFGNMELVVRELTEEAMKEGFDYLLFSAGASVSRHFAPIAASVGTTVVDNSSAFRMDSEVPLVVPEINGDILKGYRGIIANPNCSTIQMVLSLYTVHREFGISKIVVTTFQSVSGAGRKGINELMAQIDGQKETVHFPKKIHLNVIPLIGEIKEGFSTEEWKMINETRKILDDPSIEVFPTTVRVPVIYGHSESIYVETRKPFESEENLKKVLQKAEDVVVKDEIITPLEVAGSDLVHISRLRVVKSNVFMFWNVADNVRVGAATNAVRILKMHMEMKG